MRWLLDAIGLLSLWLTIWLLLVYGYALGT